MKKLLYVLHRYPQVSETYMETEIRALAGRFEVKIISLGVPNLVYENHHPYTIVSNYDELLEIATEFDPDILHGHYVFMSKHIHVLARHLKRPFTIRSHSFDVIGEPIKKLAEFKEYINSPYCLGILGFPPMLSRLKAAGYDRRKLINCYPIIEYDWFLDRSENGDAIMNVGACIPKKKMQDFVHLAASMPDLNFNLYAMGYLKEDIEKLNDELGKPLKVIPPVEPQLMPAEYKKHRWLVYTGTTKIPTVGWPLAVAEAQASGVGVCMKRVRPDLEQYVGGAGYLFDDIDEVKSIISGPVPEDMRNAGFNQAKKSSIHHQINDLVDLWMRCF